MGRKKKESRELGSRDVGNESAYQSVKYILCSWPLFYLQPLTTFIVGLLF